MLKAVFLGTKGEIEEFAKKHKFHSSLLLEHKKFKLLIDYGIESQPLSKIKPNAILITHAHPDHYAWTLKEVKTKIPVFATKETLNYGRFKPENSGEIKPWKKFKLGPFSIQTYPVLHSVRCPAVGFKIFASGKKIVYNPDLVDIAGKERILQSVDYYIGDGSSIRANLVRIKRNKIFGHARISTQIKWCEKFKVKHIIFTHLGKETISKEKKFKKGHPEILLAFDGMKIEV